MAQVTPQPPQLSTSEAVATQAVPQRLVPVGQVGLQTLAAQEVVPPVGAVHLMAQAPQLLTSEVVAMQAEPQRLVPVGQAPLQTLAAQEEVPPVAQPQLGCPEINPAGARFAQKKIAPRARGRRNASNGLPAQQRQDRRLVGPQAGRARFGAGSNPSPERAVEVGGDDGGVDVALSADRRRVSEPRGDLAAEMEAGAGRLQMSIGAGGRSRRPSRPAVWPRPECAPESVRRGRGARSRRGSRRDGTKRLPLRAVLSAGRADPADGRRRAAGARPRPRRSNRGRGDLARRAQPSTNLYARMKPGQAHAVHGVAAVRPSPCLPFVTRRRRERYVGVERTVRSWPAGLSVRPSTRSRSPTASAQAMAMKKMSNGIR